MIVSIGASGTAGVPTIRHLDRPRGTLLVGPCGAAGELPITSGRVGRRPAD